MRANCVEDVVERFTKAPDLKQHWMKAYPSDLFSNEHQEGIRRARRQKQEEAQTKKRGAKSPRDWPPRWGELEEAWSYGKFSSRGR